MIVKKHCTPDKKLILAVCDSYLIGKKFSDGIIQLDLTVDFYKGEKMSEEQTIKLLKCAYIVNLVGEKSVDAGIKAKIIDPDSIIIIEGIPHAEGVVVSRD